MSSFLSDDTRYIASHVDGDDQQTDVMALQGFTPTPLGRLDIPPQRMAAILTFGEHGVALLDTIRLLQLELEEARNAQ
jgi:hypothetical protein